MQKLSLIKDEEVVRIRASLLNTFHNNLNYISCGLKSRLLYRLVPYSNIYGMKAIRTRKSLLVLLHKIIKNHGEATSIQSQVLNKRYL